METGLKSKLLYKKDIIDEQVLTEPATLDVVLQHDKITALVSSAGFPISLISYELHTQQVVDLKEIWSTWQEDETHIFAKQYALTRLCFLDSAMLWFPKNLAVDEQHENLSHIYTGLFPKEHIQTEILLHEVSEYTLVQQVPSFWKMMFPNATYISSYNIAEICAKNIDATANNYFLIIISEKVASIYWLKNKEIKLGNTYYYQVEDDIFYHLFNICNQFGIAYQKSNVRILYQTENFLKLNRMLETYFNDVSDVFENDLPYHDLLNYSAAKNNQLILLQAFQSDDKEN